MRKLVITTIILVTGLIKLQSQTCFTRNWTGSGVDQMNFYITKATVNGINLQIGDEIGIFDGTACVGVGVLTQVLTGGSVYLSVVTSNDDTSTPAKDGFTPGNPVSYRFCTNGGTTVITNVVPNYTSGAGVFSIGGTAVVELTGTVDGPTAPIVGTITQPTCSVSTGSVVLSGLPATGTWTLTRSPGGVTTIASGTSITITGLPAPGTYTFTVTNSSGSASSSSGNVVINSQPVTPAQPGAISGATSVCQGSSQIYSILSVPGAASYSWTLPSGWSGSSGSTSITATAGSNGGIISVTANNSCGSGSARTLSIAMASLPAVTTSVVTNPSSSTAVGGGNVTSDGGSAVTARGVCWSTTIYPTISNSKTSDGASTGSFTSEITGLTNGVTYHIRAYATNCTGTVYGSDLEYLHNPTGINDIESDEISVFPNPVSGLLNIEYKDDDFKSLYILNSQGSQLAKEKAITPRQQIDFTRFEPGLYILEFIKSSGEIGRVKVINNR